MDMDGRRCGEGGRATRSGCAFATRTGGERGRPRLLCVPSSMRPREPWPGEKSWGCSRSRSPRMGTRARGSKGVVGASRLREVGGTGYPRRSNVPPDLTAGYRKVAKAKTRAGDRGGGCQDLVVVWPTSILRLSGARRGRSWVRRYLDERSSRNASSQNGARGQQALELRVPVCVQHCAPSLLLMMITQSNSNPNLANKQLPWRWTCPAIVARHGSRTDSRSRCLERKRSHMQAERGYLRNTPSPHHRACIANAHGLARWSQVEHSHRARLPVHTCNTASGVPATAVLSGLQPCVKAGLGRPYRCAAHPDVFREQLIGHRSVDGVCHEAERNDREDEGPGQAGGTVI